MLTFDCYGTLIDWESGIHTALQPLLHMRNIGLARDAILETFARYESAQEAATPGVIYSELLTEVHRQLAAEWHIMDSEVDHQSFGASVPNLQAFDDFTTSLHYLKQHYKLVILSNVARVSFSGINRRLQVVRRHIYRARCRFLHAKPEKFRIFAGASCRTRLW